MSKTLTRNRVIIASVATLLVIFILTYTLMFVSTMNFWGGRETSGETTVVNAGDDAYTSEMVDTAVDSYMAIKYAVWAKTPILDHRSDMIAPSASVDTIDALLTKSSRVSSIPLGPIMVPSSVIVASSEEDNGDVILCDGSTESMFVNAKGAIVRKDNRNALAFHMVKKDDTWKIATAMPYPHTVCQAQ